MKKMQALKILLGVHQFFPEHQTGTEVLTLEHARGLRNLGHHVSILTGKIEHKIPYSSKPWLSNYKYDNFPVYRFHYGVDNWHKIVFLELSNNDRIAMLKDLLLTIKPDIVHFNHIIGFTAGFIPATRSMGIPVVFTATDFWPVCPAYTLYRRFDKSVCEPPAKPYDCLKCLTGVPVKAAKIVMQLGQTPIHRINIKGLALNFLQHRNQEMANFINASDAIFVSTVFLKNMLEKGGISANKISVVRYGVDIGPLPDHATVPDKFTETDPLRIGFIGTLSEKKGVHVILDALGQQDNKNIKLSIFGKPDDNDPYYKLLLEKAGQSGGRVHFRGTFPHEMIGDILREMHLLVIPSVWYESSPLVLTSALNAHVPLIVSDLGGLTEMTNKGCYGYSFPPGNADMLNRTISEIVDKPEILTKFRKNMTDLKRTTKDYSEDIESEYFKILT